VWHPISRNFCGITSKNGNKEWFFGDVIQVAVDRGLNVDHVTFPPGKYIDTGVADELTQIYSSNIFRIYNPIHHGAHCTPDPSFTVSPR
jgi:hypothetical protein